MIKKVVFVVVVLISLQSCVSIALKVIGADAKKAKPKVIVSNEKQVVFVPMHHVGKKTFYTSVTKITDSLGKDGYVSYYEGIERETEDSLKLIAYERKLRKIFGYYLDNNGQYVDTINHTIMGDIKISKKYVNQPKPNKLISKYSPSYNIDYTIDRLLESFEDQYGVVALDSCDINTALSAKYPCKSLKQIDEEKSDIFDKEFVLGARNQHLANYIQTSKDDKIIVIYGKAHYKGVLEELKKLDNSWHYKGKLKY